MLPDTWNALHWWMPAAMAMLLAIPFVLWSNFSRQISSARGGFLSLAKIAAIGLLVLCLLEPMDQFEQAKPGANSLIVMADASQSLNVKDPGQSESRADQLGQLLNADAVWLTRLEKNFELKRYTFDQRASHAVDFQQLSLIHT